MVAAVKEKWRVKRENNYDGEDEGEVLWYFMEVFGTEDCEEGATVTTVTYDGDVGLDVQEDEGEAEGYAVDKKDFEMAFFFSKISEDPTFDEKTACYICKDELVRDYKRGICGW